MPVLSGSDGTLGTQIIVHSGVYVDLIDPDPATINLNDIAVSLSRQCRYGSHTPDWYSVAEHCIHAAQLAQLDGKLEECVAAILMHDAAEAYLGDMLRPLKIRIPEYKIYEDRFQAVIARRFDLNFERHSADIKFYDTVMLKAEKETFWPNDTRAWLGLSHLPSRKVPFTYWDHTRAAQRFLAYCGWLGIK